MVIGVFCVCWARVRRKKGLNGDSRDVSREQTLSLVIIVASSSWP